uniref:Uncharacterized protein n=1 Tax=Peronospora matthiolae TaxID=2874970 RepID=A0AAV1UKA0_9STRA
MSDASPFQDDLVLQRSPGRPAPSAVVVVASLPSLPFLRVQQDEHEASAPVSAAVAEERVHR